MTTYKYEAVVREALKPVEAWLPGASPGAVFAGPGREDYSYGRNDFTAARIRFDYEHKGLIHDLDSAVVHDMLNFLTPDLADMIEYGDVENLSDYLLKAIDGSVKRGVEPDKIWIISASPHWQLMPKKNSTEITLFLLVGIEWNDL